MTTLVVNNLLHLSPLLESDKPNLLLHMNDPVLFANTLRVPLPYTPADADAWVQKATEKNALYGTDTEFAIRHAEAGVIGGIGCFVKDGWDSHLDEIGYWLAAPYRGQGMMTEVVRRYVDYLFEKRPALVRIEAKTLPTNPASARVLEKVGFEREGYLRKVSVKNGKYLDSLLFALIRPIGEASDRGMA